MSVQKCGAVLLVRICMEANYGHNKYLNLFENHLSEFLPDNFGSHLKMRVGRVVIENEIVYCSNSVSPA